MATKEQQIEAIEKVTDLLMKAQEWAEKKRKSNPKYRFIERFKQKLIDNSRLK